MYSTVLLVLSHASVQRCEQTGFRFAPSSSQIPVTTMNSLLFLFVILSLCYADPSCNECIDRGCTYCKGNDFFDNPSVCICGEYSSGFFGGCDDHSFGSEELSSSLDCSFNRPNGGAILAVIIVVCILVCGCCVYANSQKNAITTPTNVHPYNNSCEVVEAPAVALPTVSPAVGVPTPQAPSVEHDIVIPMAEAIPMVQPSAPPMSDV